MEKLPIVGYCKFASLVVFRTHPINLDGVVEVGKCLWFDAEVVGVWCSMGRIKSHLVFMKDE
jgi:hypothetical protein